MDIRALIVSALEPIDAPVYWIKWAGDTNPPAKYFTFQTVSSPVTYADDKHHARQHYVYLDLFSETDPYAHVSEVREAMEGAGFVEVEFRDVGQETMSVTELVDYHISWTWSYREGV